MGYLRGKPLTFKYEYSFAVSGGAIGNIALVAKDAALEAGLVITDFSIYFEAAITSGGTPTITMGNAGTTGGYAGNFFASATLGAVLNRGTKTGALVWDDTNDCPIHYKIDSTANAIPTITVGTAALTAGKFQVYFTCYRP